MITIKTKRDLRKVELGIAANKAALVEQISKAFREQGIQMPEELKPLTNSEDVFAYRYIAGDDELKLVENEDGEVCVQSNHEDYEDPLDTGFLFDLLYIAENMMMEESTDDSDLGFWWDVSSKWAYNMKYELERFITKRMEGKKSRHLPVYQKWDTDDVMQRFAGLTTNDSFEWYLVHNENGDVVLQECEDGKAMFTDPLMSFYIEELLWIAQNV